jgi:hypothetical protein
MTFSVLLREERLPLPVDLLSPVLQETLGGVALDYVHTIRTRHGWLAHGLEQSAAEALCATLEQHGFPALLQRDGDLPDLEQRFVVTSGAMKEDALYFQETLAGDLRGLPWELMKIVALGSVPMAREKAVRSLVRSKGVNKKILMTTGIPIRKKKKKLETQFETVRDRGMLLHLVFLIDPPLILEIRPTRFDYSYLGDRATGDPAHDFRILLVDLARNGRAAHWTDMSRRYAKEGILEPEFTDEKDFLRYTRWITLKTVVQTSR